MIMAKVWVFNATFNSKSVISWLSFLLSAMICGASRPSGALAGGVLVVTIFAPIRGGNSDSLYSTIGNSNSLGLGYWLDSGHLTSTKPGQIAEY